MRFIYDLRRGRPRSETAFFAEVADLRFGLVFAFFTRGAVQYPIGPNPNQIAACQLPSAL
jgi:hypothetical protein